MLETSPDTGAHSRWLAAADSLGASFLVYLVSLVAFWVVFFAEHALGKQAVGLSGLLLLVSTSAAYATCLVQGYRLLTRLRASGLVNRSGWALVIWGVILNPLAVGFVVPFSALRSAAAARRKLQASGSALAADRQTFLSMLLPLYVTPTQAFARVAKLPRTWAPLSLLWVISLAFTGIWIAKVDPHELVRRQIEESGFAAKMGPEQVAMAVETQANLLPILVPLSAAAMVSIGLLAIGLYFWLVFRYAYGAEITFPQALSVTAFANLARALIQSPLTLGMLAFKGDWSIPPDEAFRANAALLLTKGEAANWLYALASGLDLFSVWLLVLLSIGFGVVTRRNSLAAAWAAIIPWVLFLLAQVALAAIFA